MERSKSRIPITDVERQQLRKHHQEHPSLTQQGLISWFENEFGRKISPSSISDTLSDKYSHLDSNAATEGGRKIRPQWPELENALFQYWRYAQPRKVTGPELKMKAKELWQATSIGLDKKIPSFSDGWLAKWRTRYGIGEKSKVDNDYSEQWSKGIARPLEGCHVIERPAKRQRILGQAFTNVPNGFSGGSFDLKALYTRKEETNPHPSVRKVVLDIEPELSNEIDGLLLLCSTRQNDTSIRPSQNIFQLLEVLLSEAAKKPLPHYYDSNTHCLYRQQGGVSTNILQAFESIRAFGDFQLLRSRFDIPKSTYDQWVLDYINPERIRSPSPDPIGAMDRCSRQSRDGSTGDMILPNVRQSKSSSQLSLYLSTKYRIDFFHRHYHNLSRTTKEITSENFTAQIVITPLEKVRSRSQISFRISTQIQREKSLAAMPILTFRNIRPANSRIFEIASIGNAAALEMAFCNGEGSLNDCDPQGRSLINYALRRSNISVVKYLLPKLEDVDAYEVDDTGEMMPLLGLVLQNSLFLVYLVDSILDSQKSSYCTRLLVSAGADPSLQVESIFGKKDIFLIWIEYFPMDTMRACLDEGEVFFNANSVYGLDERSLLTSLCRKFRRRYMSYQLHEKIHLLLQRGADVNAQWGSNTCLHFVFGFRTVDDLFYCPCEQIFKDILTSLVTAGADINAFSKTEGTVSEIVCQNGHEEIWLEVLAECGHELEPVLAVLKNYEAYQKYHGMSCFPVRLPHVRSTKLSFAEYCQQRKSLDCVRHKESYEIFDGRWETWEFLELLEEESDSDDYESRVIGKECHNGDKHESNGEHENENRVRDESSAETYHWENKAVMDIKMEYYGGMDYKYVWWNTKWQRRWRYTD